MELARRLTLVIIQVVLACSCCLCGGRRFRNEAELAAALRAGSGIIELPAGVIEIEKGLVIPAGAKNLEIRGNPAGSLLKARANFKGRALLSCRAASNLTLRDFKIDGGRTLSDAPAGLPPSDVSFAQFYSRNGVLAEEVTDLAIRNVSFSNVAAFPILASRCSRVVIEDVFVQDSGSSNSAGRNNTSGGILLEEGTVDFAVQRCTIRNVRGNAIWTHSNYHSARNANGRIVDNVISEVARDAIQAGHATNLNVERNRGSRIGYPVAQIDVENQAKPVALDTAGNVDRTVYADNYFEDVNGQCIDLDGFHHGEVRRNVCVNRKPVETYPLAHFGIVMGNTNPDMEPEEITVTANEIRGAGYGGIFVIGSRHQVSGNRFLNLNLNRCTGDPHRPACNYAPDQPDMLRSGIYLARGAGRPANTRDNVIRENVITGFGMQMWCLAAAPGVSLENNLIQGNLCSDE